MNQRIVKSDTLIFLFSFSNFFVEKVSVDGGTLTEIMELSLSTTRPAANYRERQQLHQSGFIKIFINESDLLFDEQSILEINEKE